MKRVSARGRYSAEIVVTYDAFKFNHTFVH